MPVPPAPHQPVNGRQHPFLQLQTGSQTVLSWLVSINTSPADAARRPLSCLACSLPWQHSRLESRQMPVRT